MTFKSSPDGRLPLLSARPAVTFPSEERHRPSTCTKLGYTAWRQRYIGVNNLPKVVMQLCHSENWTQDLLITSPTPCHHAITSHMLYIRQLILSYKVFVVRFVNLLTEDLEKTENRERAYGLSQTVDGQRQHRQLTLSDKRQTLRIFADRVRSSLCCLFIRGTDFISSKQCQQSILHHL